MKFLVLICTFTITAMYSIGFAAESNAETGRNFYEILGVDRMATAQEIKTAYRKAANKYHPDKNPKMDRRLFQAVNEAWQTLGDSSKRASYDASPASRTSGSQSTNTQSANNANAQSHRNQSQTKQSDQSTSSSSQGQRSKPEPEEPPKKKQSDPFGKDAVSHPPDNWFKHFFKWEYQSTYSRNIILYLSVAESSDSRNYLLSLMRDWDWKNSPGLRNELLNHALPLFRGFSSLRSYGDLEDQISGKTAAVQRILSWPFAIHFPELMEMALTAPGPKAAFIVENFLIKSPWNAQADFWKWMDLAISQQSKEVLEVLVLKYLPKISSDRDKHLLLERIMNKGKAPMWRILATLLPLSPGSLDCSTEIRQLLDRGDMETKFRLAQRFDKLMSEPKPGPLPSEYFKIAFELSTLDMSQEFGLYKPNVNPEHPANRDANYKTEVPKDWHTHSAYWNHNDSYVRNLSKALIESTDQTRDILLSMAEPIDWRLHMPGGSELYWRVVEPLNFVFSTTEKQERATLHTIFSLPMVENYPEIIDRWRTNYWDDKKRTAVFVNVIEEMASHSHWQKSPKLSIWIEKLSSIKSPDVDAAIVKMRKSKAPVSCKSVF